MNWSRVDRIIKNYRKDYPKEWLLFVNEMNALREEAMGEGKFKLSAKFPAYPDGERDISSEILKIMPDLIINDTKWFGLKRRWPSFFR